MNVKDEKLKVIKNRQKIAKAVNGEIAVENDFVMCEMEYTCRVLQPFQRIFLQPLRRLV